jgi:hypothetical protein
VIGGWFLPACPATAIDRGKQDDASTLTGMTADNAGTILGVQGRRRLTASARKRRAASGWTGHLFVFLNLAGCVKNGDNSRVTMSRRRSAQYQLWRACFGRSRQYAGEQCLE